MEFPFTIQDLSSKCNVSKQSIYSLFDKNKPFVNDNSIRHQRKKYYNQKVLDFLTDYYQNGKPIERQIKPTEPSSPTNEEDTTQADIKALKAKIEALEAELKVKDKQIQDLISQNGNLLLLLSQEKQEKALYLPSPKKSIGEKLRNLFSSKQA